MSYHALILGGTGAVGRATAERLLAGGWTVTVTGRDPVAMPPTLLEQGAVFVTADRNDDVTLHALLASGADLLVDAVCYTASDARGLLPFLDGVTSTVMLSSKAVYVDAEGRHSNSDDPPCFAEPIPETQATLPPGGGDHRTREGYGRNKVAAEQVLLDAGRAVTVLRPSKIHGAGARLPREWVFVKRALDGRVAVLLAERGEGVDHTSAAVNVAALIETVAFRPGSRVLNAADPDAPTALAISRAIAAHLGHEWHEVLLEHGEASGLGRHPWQAKHPVVLDTSAAAALGYEPVGTYAETVGRTVDWLVEAARGGADADLVPGEHDGFFARFFDYDAEDRAFLGQVAPAAIDEPAPTRPRGTGSGSRTAAPMSP